MTRFVGMAMAVCLLMIGCDSRRQPDFDANSQQQQSPPAANRSNNATTAGNNRGTPAPPDPAEAEWAALTARAKAAVRDVVNRHELAEFALLEPKRLELARDDLFALADHASSAGGNDNAPGPENAAAPDPRLGRLLEQHAREFAAISAALMALAGTHDDDYVACLRAVRAATDERRYGDVIRACGAFGHRYWYEFSAPIIALREWMAEIDPDAEARPIGFYGGIKICEPKNGRLPVLLAKLRDYFATYLKAARLAVVGSQPKDPVERRDKLETSLAFMVEVRDVWKLDKDFAGDDGVPIATTAAQMATDLQAAIEQMDKEK